MRVLIRSSTTSMTSVPKPLKFLRPHYDTLKQIHEKIVDQTTKVRLAIVLNSSFFSCCIIMFCILKKFCADVISVLGMTMSEGRDCLKYRLLGSHEEIGSWGHEYVRYVSPQKRNRFMCTQYYNVTVIAGI